ncbi:MAG: TetR/AcrR family transcriptional regulator C-terminal domain-containing protein, partial [Novosphingobium sp.]|nr:TetR/AcrR family transcriptional regulator C-terminal domain-containing protein [Novosphingobium sp.]
RLAGGSKATLVKYFGDRNGLIAAAVEEEARGAMAGLLLEHGDAGKGGADLAAALAVTLEGVLRFYLQPASLTIYRAVVATGGDDPGAAAAFYERGHLTIVNGLADIIARHLGIDPAVLAPTADSILHTLRSGLYEMTLLGLRAGIPADEEITARAVSAAHLVMPALEQMRQEQAGSH